MRGEVILQKGPCVFAYSAHSPRDKSIKSVCARKRKKDACKTVLPIPSPQRSPPPAMPRPVSPCSAGRRAPPPPTLLPPSILLRSAWSRPRASSRNRPWRSRGHRGKATSQLTLIFGCAPPRSDPTHAPPRALLPAIAESHMWEGGSPHPGEPSHPAGRPRRPWSAGEQHGLTKGDSTVWSPRARARAQELPIFKRRSV